MTSRAVLQTANQLGERFKNHRPPGGVARSHRDTPRLLTPRPSACKHISPPHSSPHRPTFPDAGPEASSPKVRIARAANGTRQTRSPPTPHSPHEVRTTVTGGAARLREQATGHQKSQQRPRTSVRPSEGGPSHRPSAMSQRPLTTAAGENEDPRRSRSNAQRLMQNGQSMPRPRRR